MRRVRIEVSVLSEDSNINRLLAVCEERGWEVSEEPERLVGAERTTGKVDVILRGSVFLARRAAIREIIHLAERRCIDIQIRHAELVHPPANPVMYRIYKSPDAPSGPMNRMLAYVGWYDVASVGLINGETKESREGRLQEEFPGQGYKLRHHVLWLNDPGQNFEYERRRVASVVLFSVIACMIAIAIALTPIWGSPTVWRLSLCLPLATIFFLLLALAVSNESGPTRRKVVAVIIGAAVAALASAGMYALGGPWMLPVSTAGLLGVLGLRILLVGASTGLVASWVIPLIVSIILSGLPGVNGIYQDVYLRTIGFDDGVGSVPVSEFQKAWPPIEAVAEGWAVVFLVISPLGFLRYLHVSRTVLHCTFIFLLPVALMSGVMKVVDDFTGAIERGESDSRLISHGGVPSTYLGLHPELVKVRQLSKDSPFEGCRPKTGETYLSFGTVRDRITLLKPGEDRVCKVRLEDYGLSGVDAKSP